MVDVASMLMLMSFFGPEFAIFYTVVGVILAVVGGKVLSIMKVERYLKKYDGAIRDFYAESEYFNQRQRLNYALNDTKIIVRKVFPYVLLGVLIGAVIHNWIPQEFILSILGNNNPFAVILATVIGVPIYADIFGTLPIEVAYNECDYYADQLLDYLTDNLNYLRKYLQDNIPQIKVYNHQATYLVWLDCSAYADDDKVLSDKLREAKVELNSGIQYGNEGHLKMRINVACPQSILTEGLNRVKQALV